MAARRAFRVNQSFGPGDRHTASGPGPRWVEPTPAWTMMLQISSSMAVYSNRCTVTKKYPGEFKFEQTRNYKGVFHEQ